jgi:peptidoglycan/LPS O-acetylase OafA/YrhL
MQYRPEIDGLRAFAILPVLFYHAGFPWMPGGWLGVDVFFVISGFLITGILLRDLENGEFSLRRFYERRARRILPALTIVILATLIAAPFLLWPWQLQELGQSVIATSTFTANLFFESKIDYFRADAEQYPLIHMWSLAIEEQYYLVLPLLLAGLWAVGFRAGKIFAALAIISVFSFFAAHVRVVDGSSAAFYLIQYRAYELCAGSLAAVVAFRGWMLRDTFARVALPLGLALIVFAVAFTKEATGDPFLRITTLIGTVLVLLSAPKSGAGLAILNSKPIRFIGLISFSLYLWHQPVFAFIRNEMEDPSHLVMSIAIMASLGLSFMSWKYVETPPRKANITRTKVFAYSLIAIVLTISLGAYYAKNFERITSVDPFETSLSVAPSERAQYVRAVHKTHQTRSFSDSKLEKILLIGDSFSQDFLNMAAENDAFEHVDLVAHYIPAKCQPYFGTDDISKHISKQYRKRCNPRSRLAPPRDLVEQADTIILASNWRPWTATRIVEIVDSFRAREEQRIIVIGSKSIGGESSLNLRKYRKMSQTARPHVRIEPSDRFVDIYGKMIGAIGSTAFVDVQKLLCTDGIYACPVFTPDGDLISFDGVHLTQEGAAYLGKLVFSDPHLSGYLSDRTGIEVTSKQDG